MANEQSDAEVRREMNELKLNDIMSTGKSGMKIQKVVGGWVYWYVVNKNESVSGVFVPYEKIKNGALT